MPGDWTAACLTRAGCVARTALVAKAMLTRPSLLRPLGARSQPFKPLQLLHSGNTLRPGTLVNPPVLVSNYTFCVIEMDAFKITPDANMYAPGSWAHRTPLAERSPTTSLHVGLVAATRPW